MRWQVFKLLSQMLGGKNLAALVAVASKQALWPAVLTLSSYNLVTPNLYWALSRDPVIWHSLPRDAQEYLSNIFELNTLRNQTIVHEVSHLITALNEQNITPLILKNTGELLSKRTPHIGYRMQTDIDLMVKPAQLKAAYALIQQRGYNIAQEQLSQHGSILKVATRESLAHVAREYQHHQHLAPLIKTGAVASVELHRHAYGPRFQQRFALTDIFEQAQLQTLDGLAFLLMSPLQRQRHLVYHSYIGDGCHARYELPLRAACDWLHTGKNSVHTGNEPQLAFFDALVNSMMRGTVSNNKAVAWQQWGIKIRHHNRILGPLIGAFGKLKNSCINIRHNPQKLRRRWRLLLG